MKQISWGFVLAGFGSLLVSSFYDNIRGPLIPPVAEALGLSFVESGWFLALSQVVATGATLSLIHALNRWSERSVMLALGLVGITTALMASAVTGLASLMVLAALVGSTISPLGTMANVLIVEGAPPSQTGRFLSALHAMFGIGSMIATATVGFGIGRGWPWSRFYLLGLPVFLALMLWSARFLRRHDGRRGPQTVQAARLSAVQALVVATFAVYVAGEVTTAAWMTSFLVTAHGLDVASAAPYLTAYYLVMALTRMACAFLVTPEREPIVLRAAMLLPIVFFTLGYRGDVWALALVGTYGPFFPLLLGRASRAFPESWRSMTIWTIVVMNAFLGLCSVTVGDLADRFGIAAAYLAAAVLMATAFLLVNLCLRKLPTTPAT